MAAVAVIDGKDMIDFTSASISFDMLYPEISLLVAAFVILLISSSRQLSRASSAIALIGIAVSMLLAVGQWGHQTSGFFGMVTCDNFGAAFKVIFTGIAVLALLMSLRYFRAKHIARPEYYALLLISTAGMMIMANTTDLIVMFMGLEIMSVPLYVMAGFARRSLESNEAGIKYFLMGAFASGFLLMGIAFIFGAAGTTDLRRIVADFSFIVSNYPLYIYSGVGLVLIGFGFKVGAVPFHSWIPDVYQGAPTPVTAFFSVGPKAAGFAVMLRIFLYGFDQMQALSMLFWGLAVLTMTVGNVLALRQENVKRMLAYSSISHAGYIMVALAVGGKESISAAMFYLIGYALFNTGAFAIITMLEIRQGSKALISEFAGMAKTNPYLSATLALFMFSLAGFPPTVGFFGKFYLFSAAVKAGFIWLAVIGVMNSFISVYYYLRVVKAAYLDSSEEGFAPIKFPPSLMVVIVITALGTLGLGFFPQAVIGITQRALFAFL